MGFKGFRGFIWLYVVLWGFRGLGFGGVRGLGFGVLGLVA